MKCSTLIHQDGEERKGTIFINQEKTGHIIHPKHDFLKDLILFLLSKLLSYVAGLQSESLPSSS